MKSLVAVAHVEDIRPGRAGLVHLGGHSIAIFNAGGAFYATDEYCTGDGGSLSEGTLLGATITCSSDRCIYYLPTGESLDSKTKPLTTYAVHIHGEVIKLDRNEFKRNPFPVFDFPSFNEAAWLSEARI
ncbi:MAG: Rieske 2Fe-2S domain-containing protein [Candidatus Binatia bacterium]